MVETNWIKLLNSQVIVFFYCAYFRKISMSPPLLFPKPWTCKADVLTLWTQIISRGFVSIWNLPMSRIQCSMHRRKHRKYQGKKMCYGVNRVFHSVACVDPKVLSAVQTTGSNWDQHRAMVFSSPMHRTSIDRIWQENKQESHSLGQSKVNPRHLDIQVPWNRMQFCWN